LSFKTVAWETVQHQKSCHDRSVISLNAEACKKPFGLPAAYLCRHPSLQHHFDHHRHHGQQRKDRSGGEGPGVVVEQFHLKVKII